MTDTPAPRWANRRKTCDYAGVSDATFYRYVSAGVFVRHDIGGGLYDLNQIDAAIRRRATPGNRSAEIAGVIARIRAALPSSTGRPLIPVAQVHAAIDRVEREITGVDRRHAGLGLPCEICPGPCTIDGPAT